MQHPIKENRTYWESGISSRKDDYSSRKWEKQGEKLADESNESVMFLLPAGLVSSLSAS